MEQQPQQQQSGDQQLCDSNIVMRNAADAVADDADDVFEIKLEQSITATQQNNKQNSHEDDDEMLEIVNKLQQEHLTNTTTTTASHNMTLDAAAHTPTETTAVCTRLSALQRSKPSMLPRQRHTSEEDYQPPPDEADYAADLEENDDYDDEDCENAAHQRTLTPRSAGRLDYHAARKSDTDEEHNEQHITPHKTIKTNYNNNNLRNINNNNIKSSDAKQSALVSASSLPKHIQFQMHKPQSTNALISNSASNSDKAALKHSSSVCSMSEYVAPRDKRGQAPSSPQSKCNPQYYRQRLASANGIRPPLQRDYSSQSDSSRYSSVDSLLESRKPDSEAILNNMFGSGSGSDDILSRIPKRFMKPSQVRGINTEMFVKRIQLASAIAENSVLGYRGLTGNPDIPPSSIVAKIMQRFEVNQRKKSLESIRQTMR